ncbi:MAG TPA: hydroxymethylbilane synthase [Stellaceae bacterium]|jgi:hydroxymethylbilane synthase
MSEPLLRIGTRGSALALVQTAQVAAALAVSDPALAAPGAIATVPIRTTGDKVQDRPVAEIGGKALFAREIEEALLDGRIDIAVHSTKDLPTFLPQGLAIAAYLKREDPRDAFLSRRADSLEGLPRGAAVGTSSPRRTAQLLHERPDLKIVQMRGNVDTRVRKLDGGDYDAIVLALAGLKRLGLADRVTSIIPAEQMLPAPAQGAIALETRADDNRAVDYCVAINHAETSICVGAERAFLAVLGGDCRTPIAALARIDDGLFRFRAEILKPDGSARLAAARDGEPREAILLATDAGHDLVVRAGAGFFA